MHESDFSVIASALLERDIDICTSAAARLHSGASAENIPALLELLRSDDFFVREAAAWPLAELSGIQHLPELFVAYQRGFDDGHDNDGFTAALLEIPALFPIEAAQALQELAKSVDPFLQEHAEWLLSFCDPERKE